MSSKSETIQSLLHFPEETEIPLNLIQEKIFRCPLCMQIPRISIIGTLKNSMIIYICKCGKNEVPLNLFLKEFTENQILFSNCSFIKHDEITKNKKNENNMNFCIECKKCFCDSCILIHDMENINISHRKVSINNLDTYCTCNKNPAQGFCLLDNENVCYDCKNNHNNHKIIQPFDFNLTNLEIETFKNNFKEVLNLIQNNNKNYKDEIVKILKHKISEIEKAYNENLEINNKILKIFSNYYLMKNVYPSYFIYPILSTLKNIHFNITEKNPIIKDSSDITKIFQEGLSYFKNYSVIDMNKTYVNVDQLTNLNNETINIKSKKKLYNPVNNSSNIPSLKKYGRMNNRYNNIKNNDYMLTSDKTSSNNSSENITKYSSFGSRKKYLVKSKEKKEKDNFSNKKYKKTKSIYSAYNKNNILNNNAGVTPRKTLPQIYNVNKKNKNYNVNNNYKNSKEYGLNKIVVHEEKNRYNEISQVEFIFKKI